MISCFIENTHMEARKTLRTPDRVLRDAFNCNHTATLFKYLEYWYAMPKFKEGFYKFLQPCKKHVLYREGDSWEEELKFGKKVFYKCFDKIGVRYKSKSAFMSENDPFKGKLYASYFDRKQGKTYYLRNHLMVENFIHITLKSFALVLSNKKNKNPKVDKESTQKTEAKPVFFVSSELPSKAPRDLSLYIIYKKILHLLLRLKVLRLLLKRRWKRKKLF